MKKQIIIFTMIIGVSVFLATKQYYESESTPTPTETSSVNSNLDISDWNSYSDKASGIIFSYPNDWSKSDCPEYDSDKDNCFVFNAMSDKERPDSGIKFYTSRLTLPSLMAWYFTTISLERESTDTGLTYIVRRIHTADPSGYIEAYYIPKSISDDNSRLDDELVYGVNQRAQIVAITSQPTPTMEENPEYAKNKNAVIMAILNSVDY